MGGYRAQVDADALLFCTGAGWSADSGLAVYRDIAKVEADLAQVFYSRLCELGKVMGILISLETSGRSDYCRVISVEIGGKGLEKTHPIGVVQPLVVLDDLACQCEPRGLSTMVEKLSAFAEQITGGGLDRRLSPPGKNAFARADHRSQQSAQTGRV